MNNVKMYPVYNAHGTYLGDAATATKAGKLLGVDALVSDDSGKSIQVTLSNVKNQFSWTDSRLAQLRSQKLKTQQNHIPTADYFPVRHYKSRFWRNVLRVTLPGSGGRLSA